MKYIPLHWEFGALLFRTYIRLYSITVNSSEESDDDLFSSAVEKKSAVTSSEMAKKSEPSPLISQANNSEG
jgi:hypothetical protein